MKATAANPTYQKTAQSEEEAREATLQDRRANDEEIASLARRDRRRVRLIFGLVTVMLAAAVVAAYTQRDRFGLWGTSLDSIYWPFTVSLRDVSVREHGEYGNVFDLLLSDEQDRFVKPSPGPGISRAVYQREVGSLRMRVTDNEGILFSWRRKLWWFQPEWITAKKRSTRLQDETIMILGRDEQDPDLYRLVLPLILPDEDGFTSLTLKSSSSSDESSVMLSSETGGRVALYSGRGSDPYALFREGVMFGSLLASANQTVPVIKSASRISRLPEFARHLGWCTWNAMYTNMTGSKLLDSVTALHNAEVPARWMIIDDGWQHTTNDSLAVIEDRNLRFPERLKKLDSCPEKFGPDDGGTSNDMLSLRETIRLIKSPRGQQGGGMTHVLGWHAMLGYWIGIDPTKDTSDDQWRRPAASLYYSHFSMGYSDPENITSVGKGVGVPNDANEFLDRYYDYMTSAGFDGVKTDVQARTGPLRPFSTEHDDPTYRHRHQVAARMLDALASNVGKFLNTNDTAQSTLPIIHCMSHAPELMYRIPSLFGPRLPLLRASDDFFPLNPQSHGPMIAQTSVNSLFLGHLATPDWDMFQSVLPDIDGLPGYAVSRFHAMARSISGGPIYVSDTSDATNATLLKSVACEEGTVLPCSDVGRPIVSMLLRDPFETEEPFVIFNTNGIPNGEVTSGVLGIFQLSGSGGSVKIRPSDVEAFRTSLYEETSFLAVSFASQKAWVLDNNSAQVDISGEGQLWSDIVTFIPIRTKQLPVKDADLFFDIVPLGIVDKFNGAGAIIRAQITAVSSTKARARLSIRGCGKFGFLFRLRNSEHEWDHLRSTIKAEIGHPALELVRVRLDKSSESLLHGLDRTGLDLVTFNVTCVDSGVLDEERWVSIDLGSQRS